MGILHDVEILVPIIHSETGMINMLLVQVFENLFVSADSINLHNTKIL